MRGEDTKQSSMLMLMSPEARVPATHPLRAIKKLADAGLAELSPVFDEMYSAIGRPSGPSGSMIASAPAYVRGPGQLSKLHPLRCPDAIRNGVSDDLPTVKTRRNHSGAGAPTTHIANVPRPSRRTSEPCCDHSPVTTVLS